MAIHHPSVARTCLRVLVRDLVDTWAPICGCSAEVADRFLVDLLANELHLDELVARPEFRLWGSNDAMQERARATVIEHGGWFGCVEWLNRQMDEKVKALASSGAPPSVSLSRTVISSYVILRRLGHVGDLVVLVRSDSTPVAAS